MANLADAKKLAMSMLDVDGDHRISRSDFEKAVNKNDSDQTGKKPADIERLKDSVMKMCDAIGLVGTVSYSYEGYREHVQSQLSNPQVDKSEVDAAFKSLDKSGDGKISRDEWIAAAYEFFYTSLWYVSELNHEILNHEKF